MTSSLLTEIGEFFLNDLNNAYITFAFRGDAPFIKRIENFLINTGTLLNGNLHQISDNFYYSLVPLARLKRGLALQFRAEIIQSKSNDINYLLKEIKDEYGDVVDFEIEWDENKLEQLANGKMEEFLNKCLRDEIGVYINNKTNYHEYSLGDIEQSSE